MIDSVHLNFPLVSACKAEISSACKSASNPEVELLTCLQRAALTSTPAFSTRCVAAVSWVTQTQLSDIRFNPRLMTACAAEVLQLCPETGLNSTQAFRGAGVGSLASLGRSKLVERTGGLVLECLSSKMDLIKSEACAQQVKVAGMEKQQCVV